MSTYLSYTLTVPTAGSISITSPYSGDSWTAGSSYDIEWTATSTSGYFDIELYSNSGSSYYSTSTSDYYDGNGADYYYWSIPSTIPAGSYEIYIEDYSSSTIYDFSDTFSIVSLMPTTPGYSIGFSAIAILLGALAVISIALKKRKMET
jgi:hypothetical protein